MQFYAAKKDLPGTLSLLNSILQDGKAPTLNRHIFTFCLTKLGKESSTAAQMEEIWNAMKGMEMEGRV